MTRPAPPTPAPDGRAQDGALDAAPGTDPATAASGGADAPMASETAHAAVGDAGGGAGDAADEDAALARLTAAIGARVRAGRGAVGLTRRALADRSGVSQRYLAEVEAGRGNISVALLHRIARALDTPIVWLLDADAQANAPTTERWRKAPSDRTTTTAQGGLAEARLAPPAQTDEASRLAGLIARADAATRARALDLLAGAEAAGAGKARRICLIGLRGAGKSTLGARLAADLALPFVELNREIEAEAGMGVGDVIALYGAETYRRLERAALDRTAARHDALVLAVAGGVVEAAESYDALLARFHTIWLSAAPDDHMARVRAQGDERPMAGVPKAMEELRRILAARAPAYARADARLDTSGEGAAASAARLAALVAARGFLD